jgi:hypothetical protein
MLLIDRTPNVELPPSDLELTRLESEASEDDFAVITGATSTNTNTRPDLD